MTGRQANPVPAGIWLDLAWRGLVALGLVMAFLRLAPGSRLRTGVAPYLGLLGLVAAAAFLLWPPLQELYKSMKCVWTPALHGLLFLVGLYPLAAGGFALRRPARAFPEGGGGEPPAPETGTAWRDLARSFHAFWGIGCLGLFLTPLLLDPMNPMVEWGWWSWSLLFLPAGAAMCYLWLASPFLRASLLGGLGLLLALAWPVDWLWKETLVPRPLDLSLGAAAGWVASGLLAAWVLHRWLRETPAGVMEGRLGGLILALIPWSFLYGRVLEGLTWNPWLRTFFRFQPHDPANWAAGYPAAYGWVTVVADGLFLAPLVLGVWAGGRRFQGGASDFATKPSAFSPWEEVFDTWALPILMGLLLMVAMPAHLAWENIFGKSTASIFHLLQELKIPRGLPPQLPAFLISIPFLLGGTFLYAVFLTHPRRATPVWRYVARVAGTLAMALNILLARGSQAYLQAESGTGTTTGKCPIFLFWFVTGFLLALTSFVKPPPAEERDRPPIGLFLFTAGCYALGWYGLSSLAMADPVLMGGTALVAAITIASILPLLWEGIWLRPPAGDRTPAIRLPLRTLFHLGVVILLGSLAISLLVCHTAEAMFVTFAKIHIPVVWRLFQSATHDVSTPELLARILPPNLWTGTWLLLVLPVPVLFLACLGLLGLSLGFLLLQRARHGRYLWGFSFPDREGLG
ncbi:MAG: hypothetical protein GX442_23940 [Candidatus Riflebacteria bacterium]|nr:hypothetical protein [Candidatus Riflebacteria bacterium]